MIRWRAFLALVVLGLSTGMIMLGAYQIRALTDRNARLTVALTQSRRDAEWRWWLITTATSPPLSPDLVAAGWPEEIMYFHTIRDFQDRVACEARRKEEQRRAESIAKSVGPHYVTVVSRCRHAILRREEP